MRRALGRCAQPGCAAVLALLLAGCGPADHSSLSQGEGRAEQGLPATARPDIVATLREDLQLERHPSDGAGRAWLRAGPSDGEPVGASELGRWTIVYEAGPLGVAKGGMIFLQVSPFWGWSTPQVIDPERPGYTEVSTDSSGVELRPATLGQQLLGIEIDGRPLRQGERIEVVYGAGKVGALADRFAERGSRFWIGVDGDGDGIRATLADSPAVEIVARQPARLVLTLPSSARPGDRVRLTIAAVDPLGNAGVPFAGAVELSNPGSALRLPERVALEPADAGATSVEIEVFTPGVYRIRGRVDDRLTAESNPLVVSEDGSRILWGDLHGHSNFSDGTGTPADYFRYARDVAGLDVVALTDHDHWGVQPLAQHPEMWQEIVLQTRRFHHPQRFVTLLGYEWTNWIYGHRHVLFFDDDGEVLSAVDPLYDHPQELWQALRGQDALTLAHHSAGGPIAVDWEIPPDPELEPVTEIVSVHGSSEAPDSPGLIYSPVAGNFVRDALARGYRLGFVGSGDSHDGHPGLAGLASPTAGLAAILSEDLDRPAILAALRRRAVYATNGPRIVLRLSLDGRPMGSDLPPAAAARLAVAVIAPHPLERIDLIRSGAVAESIAGEGREEVRFERRLRHLVAGEYLYVRAVQSDGGAAWSSPFFVR